MHRLRVHTWQGSFVYAHSFGFGQYLRISLPGG
jgi:hypothetical protein